MSFAFFKINKTKDLVDVPKNSALEKVELKHLFSSAHKYISYLIVALILIFIGEFIFLTLEKFSSFSTFPNNFFPTLFNTILLSSGVALMAVCMSIMLCFVSSALRRFLFVTMAISAVLILYLWSSSFLNLISESNSLVKFLFLAIAVLMISFPIFTRWINEQLQLIPDDYQSTSILLGLSSWDYFNVIVFPRLKNCFERIFIFAFLITMGDVALSSYILPFEASLLSLMARKASQHYDFSVAPFVFWSQFVICLFFVLLQERKFIFCKKKSTLIEANYA
jgi:ABC-type Fe3+ transport system permease subunit